MTTSIKERIKKPAPKWYRIFDRVYGPAESLIMVLMVNRGYAEYSMDMINFKAISSFIRFALDSYLIESKND